MSAKWKDHVEVARAYNQDQLASKIQELSDAEDALEARKTEAQQVLNTASATRNALAADRRAAEGAKKAAEDARKELDADEDDLEAKWAAFHGERDAFESQQLEVQEKLAAKQLQVQEREREARAKAAEADSVRAEYEKLLEELRAKKQLLDSV